MDFSDPEIYVAEINQIIAESDPERYILADGIHLVAIVPESYTDRWSKR